MRVSAGHPRGWGGRWGERPPDPAQVTRPDGSTVTVTGGVYVLTTPGVHKCAGKSITAK